MKPIAAFALLALLAGCSPRPPGNDAAPAPDTETAPASPVAADAPDSHATPHPPAARPFTDWTAACDNGGACSVAPLSPEVRHFYAVKPALTLAGGPAGHTGRRAGLERG